MTISIERARELLPPELSQTTDEEIQRMLNYVYFVLDFAWNWQEKHPWETFPKRERKIQDPEPVFNKERHISNRMPLKATLDQKIKWHIEHIAHCKCRPIPEIIKQEIQKRLG